MRELRLQRYWLFILVGSAVFVSALQAQDHSLRVDVDFASLLTGQTVQVRASFAGTDVTSVPSTRFTSSDPGVATVSSSGLLTAIAPGQVVVTVVNDEVDDSGTVEGSRTLDVYSAGDRDGDGLPDSWESVHGLNPDDASDAHLDADGDGLDNTAEYVVGSDPQNADTDGDGMSDYDEVQVGRNPGSKDVNVTALDDHCVVSVLNRTAQVKADGSWVLSNVPANSGLVRARATCVADGVTRNGSSELFLVPSNGVVRVVAISFDAPKPVPARLALASVGATLSRIGDSSPLRSTVTFPDGSTLDVTGISSGTSYTTSNPGVATISDTGVITAMGSGVAIISATNDGALGLLRITVAGAADSDGDGIPDDYELANGLDPHNAADAALDADNDGLSNLEEYGNGTGVHNPDSDGDGIRDGLEIQTGSDPLDPGSFNLARALRGVVVSPANVVLRVNPLFSETAQQLSVAGTTLDGAVIDLTSAGRGTAYTSSDLTICNFSGTSGQLLAGNTGVATVTVTSNGFSVSVPVQVEAYRPHGVTSIPVPGYANNVKVKGGYAYIASGSGGLQVVDVQNPSAPLIAGSLALDGNAIDLRIRGNSIFVACGDAGLKVVDISNPVAPRLIGSVDTAGVAQDVWLDGNFAYVADQDDGLVVINITDPTSPALLASVAVGTARGVSVEGGVAAVATDTGLAIVDVSTPTAAHQISVLVLAGQPKDVVMRAGYAYVASYTGGLQIADLRSPLTPAIAGAIPDSFAPRDVILSGNFAVLAEQLFPNAIPFVDVATPSNPIFRGIIDLEPIADYAATGIDVTARNVFLTEESFVVSTDYGVTGDTRLFIAEYRTFTDTAGVPPTVRISLPANGQTVVRGASEVATIEASDDVAIAEITLLVDGQLAGSGTGSPASITFTVPASANTVTLTATAIDFGSNSTTSVPVTLTAIADPLTMVTGVVKDEQGRPVSGATVTVAGHQAATGATGDYRVTDVPTVSGNLIVQATAQIDGKPANGTSSPVRAVRGGTTVIPDIVVRSIVWIVQPVPGQFVVEGEQIPVELGLTAGFQLDHLSIFVNGMEVQQLYGPPFVTTVSSGGIVVGLRAGAPVAKTAGPLTIGAVAFDRSGNRFAAADVTVTVGPDPLTTAVGVVKKENGQPVQNATVSIGTIETTTDATGAYQLGGLSTISGAYVVMARAVDGADRLAGKSSPVVPVRGGITPIPDIVVRVSSCGEPECVPAEGIYVSHFTGPGCTGTESYYTAYDNFRFNCRSWDGGGQCGTIRRTVTNRSARIENGPCQDLWPDGNTIDNFVTVYRDDSRPAQPTTVTGVLIADGVAPPAGSVVSCLGVNGASAADGTFSMAGVPTGSGSILCTAHFTSADGSAYSGASHSVLPVPGGTTDVGTVILFGPSPSAGVCTEPVCVPSQAMFVSHFSAPGCAGTESYYLPYDGYAYQCRTWDGNGQCGSVRRTQTNYSVRVNGGPCQDAWPDGNRLDDFVTVYRGRAGD